MSLIPTLHVKTPTETAWRISPNDSNYFIILFDPTIEGFKHVAVIEIFEAGGMTPPNSHTHAYEIFYVLHGRGLATSGDKTFGLAKGDALLLRPGTEHVIENTGPGKLYTLTMMMPDEDFAQLIRSGTPVPLDNEDRLILAAIGVAEI